jgi:hypothetical protein
MHNASGGRKQQVTGRSRCFGKVSKYDIISDKYDEETMDMREDPSEDKEGKGERTV